MIAKFVKILIGLTLLSLGVWASLLWWGDMLSLVRGGLGLFLILTGLIAFALIAD